MYATTQPKEIQINYKNIDNKGLLSESPPDDVVSVCHCAGICNVHFMTIISRHYYISNLHY